MGAPLRQSSHTLGATEEETLQAAGILLGLGLDFVLMASPDRHDRFGARLPVLGVLPEPSHRVVLGGRRGGLCLAIDRYQTGRHAHVSKSISCSFYPFL